jgi:DUF1365 family protein
MNDLASAIYVGSVVHTRLRPVRHRLRYRMLTMLLDLDELRLIADKVLIFSTDRFNVFSFHARDHLAGDGTSLRVQIEQHLDRAGIGIDGGPIRVLCMPRVLGFVFNPLSVFFCHDPAGELRAVLCEVNNTFGERHAYLIPATGSRDNGLLRQSCRKCFYVSPFMEMDLQYHFRLAPPAARAAVAIEAHDDAGPVLSACFAGRRSTLSTGALFRLLPRHPALALQVLGGIHWEALKLWRKGIRLHPRPRPPRQPITIVGAAAERIGDA